MTCDLAETITSTHVNREYLPDYQLPNDLRATSSLEEQQAAGAHSTPAPPAAGPRHDDIVLTFLNGSLAGQTFMCIDSPVKHGFTFTPAMSLFVDCADEPEIDTLFAKLSEGGQVLMPLGQYPFASKFGWVSDQFGVSWQLNLPNS